MTLELTVTDTPVGPMASAVGSSRQGILFAITSSLVTFGGCPSPEVSRIRTTVELLIVCTPFAAPPLSTLLTKRVDSLPLATVAIDQGPWMFAL